MKKQKQGRSKVEIEFENTYSSNLKNNLHLHKQKQYSRQFDDIKYLPFQDNLNVLSSNPNNNNSYQQQYDQYDEGENYDEDYGEDYQDDEYNEEYQEDYDEAFEQCCPIQAEQSKTIQNEKENNEDLLVAQLKQQFNYFQYVKDQLISILIEKKVSEQILNQENSKQAKNLNQTLKDLYKKFTGSFKTEMKLNKIQNPKLQEETQKYKTEMFLKFIYQNRQPFTYNLNFQLQINNKNSSATVGLNNSSIIKKNIYPYFLTQQEISSLNHFSFSAQSIINPENFKNQLKEFLSNEKRLYYIQFLIDSQFTKQILEKIDENELLLDLIPSTTFTKIIDLQLDTHNVWSLLLALNCLLSLNNYNIINLQNVGYRRRGQQAQQLDPSHYLEQIFDAILQQRALQSLDITNIEQFIQPFINSLKKVDLGSLYLKSLQISSQLSQKNHSVLLNMISQLPYISHFSCQGFILDSLSSVENLNSLLKRLISVNISLIQVPAKFDYKFDFSNLKFLQLSINIYQQEMTNERLENFFKSLSESVHLKYLNVKFLSSYQDRNKKKKSNKQEYNEEDDGDENNGEDEMEVEDGDEGDIDDLVVENYQNCEEYKFFEYLDELQHLKKIELQMEIGQRLTNSLLKYLKKAKYLKNFSLNSNSSLIDNRTYQVQLQEFDIISSHHIDFKNIYEVLNNNQNLETVELNLQQYSIKYENITPETNDYKLTLNATNQADYKGIFNPLSFKLSQLLEITFICQPINNQVSAQLEDILSSISHCPNIQSISLQFTIYEPIHQNYENSNKNLLFKHLINLNQLQTLKLSTGYNLEILDSLCDFILLNKSIKNLILTRCNYYHLDFSKFMKNLAKSSSLERVSFINFMLVNITHLSEKQVVNAAESEFYTPLSSLIENKDRKINRIDFNQYYFHKQQIENLLNSLLKATSPIVMSFDQQVVNQLPSYQEVQKLYQKCFEKKLILDQSQTQLLNNI